MSLIAIQFERREGGHVKRVDPERLAPHAHTMLVDDLFKFVAMKDSGDSAFFEVALCPSGDEVEPLKEFSLCGDSREHAREIARGSRRDEARRRICIVDERCSASCRTSPYPRTSATVGLR